MKNEEFLLKSALGGFLLFYLPFKFRFIEQLERSSNTVPPLLTLKITNN